MNPVHLVDAVNKPGFVWQEEQWKHEDAFHRHKKAQLIFVAEGYQHLHTDKNRFLLPANHAAWIPSNQYHKTSTDLENVSLWTLYYSQKEWNSFYEKLHLFAVPPVLKQMILHTKKWSLNQSYDRTEQVFLQAIRSELPAFKKSGPPLQLPLPKDPDLFPVVEHINNHLSNLIQVKDLAEVYPFSLRTLERKFKQDLGMTVARYIQLAKIIKSVELLSQRRLSVKEIAQAVGYAGSESFSNRFVQLMGKRPSEFMKTNS